MNNSSVTLRSLLKSQEFLEEEGHKTGVLTKYATQCEDWGYYYVGLSPVHHDMDMPLTNEFFENTIKASHKRYEDCPPCNGSEGASVGQAMGNMFDFQKLYQVFLNHLLYRPPDENIPGDKGGIEYQRLCEETLVGKK